MDKNLRLFILIFGIFIIINSGYYQAKELKNQDKSKDSTFTKINFALSIIALPFFIFYIYKVYENKNI
jgi:hypothetical protein